MSIRVSPKHGVNPSVMLCFYCNKSYGVALLGHLPGDEEAPRQAVFDKAPCEECAAFMKLGVILISVDPTKSTDPQNPWRSGGWVVVTDEAIARLINDGTREYVLKRRVAFIEDEAWDALGLPREEVSYG